MRSGSSLRRTLPDRRERIPAPLIAFVLLWLMLFSPVVPVYAQEDPAAGDFSAGDFAVGEVLTGEQAQSALASLDDYFYAEPISGEVFARIDGKTYPEGCPLSLDSLRYLRVLHYNFDHEIQSGELIVSTDLADIFLEIFRELFDAEYEIYSMHLPEEFWTGDAHTTDDASVAADNTSAFCYRTTASGSSLSNHAAGRAIDINPLENPYLTVEEDGSFFCDQEGSLAYMDRSADLDHMISSDDFCYQIFTEYGFTWGGSWSSPIDYQHFERTW